MKVACDRCLKVVDVDNQGIPNDWLSLTTGLETKYLFCKKCSDVFWDAMFDCNYGADPFEWYTNEDGDADDTTAD